MNIIARTLAAFGRTRPPQVSAGAGTGYVRPNIHPVLQVRPEECLENSAVASCIGVVSKAIAASPFEVVQESKAKDGTIVRTVVWDAPEGDILNLRPNPEMTASQVKSWLAQEMLVWGVAYAHLVRDSYGAVKEIWPLRATHVTMKRTTSGALYYEVRQANAGTIALRSDEMLRVVAPGHSLNEMVGDLVGLSAVGTAGRALALARAAEDLASDRFVNGANVGGVVTHPHTLVGESLREYKESLAAEHQGPGNGGGTLFLTGGAQYTQVEAPSAREAQLLESRQYSAIETCRFFGVHPAIALGDPQTSAGYGSNVQAFKESTRQNGIDPIAQALAEALTLALFPFQSRLFILVQTAGYLDPGKGALAAAHAQQVGRPTMTPNEARRELGLPSLPGGDTLGGNEPPPPANPPRGVSQPVEQREQKTAERNAEKLQAAAAVMASALDRHARRVKARRREVSPDALAANLAALAEETARELSNLLTIAGLPSDTARASVAVSAVDAGVEPRKAADELVR